MFLMENLRFLGVPIFKHIRVLQIWDPLHSMVFVNVDFC